MKELLRNSRFNCKYLREADNSKPCSQTDELRYDRDRSHSPIAVSAQRQQPPTSDRPQTFPGEVFADPAEFDRGIRQLLPRYDEMIEAIVLCLPAETERILDLGCGTGELSRKLFDRFPKAQIVAVDYSPRMLATARSKLEAAGYGQQWRGMEGDFGDWTIGKFAIEEGFDACVSSLAIHHLTDEMKLKLFVKIRQTLNRDGVFWNADPVVPEAQILSDANKQIRERWAEQQGTTLAEIRAKTGTSTPYGHSQPDQLATLEAHLQMLTTAGFETVAVPWKYYGMAVFGGIA